MIGGYRKIVSVCEWAFQTLKVVKKPAYEIVFQIIRDGARIEMKAKLTHLNLKSDLSVTCGRIESMLIEWCIEDVNERNSSEGCTVLNFLLSLLVG